MKKLFILLLLNLCLQVCADTKEVYTAESYFLKGYNSYLEKNYAEAEKEFVEAIKMDTNLFKAHIFLAKTLEKNKKYADALDTLDFVLYQDPENIEAVELKQKITELASKTTDDTKTAAEFYENGYKYYQRKDFYNAIQNYEKALFLNPELVEAYYWKARIYYELGEYEKSRNEVSFLLEKKPEHVMALELNQKLTNYFSRRSKFSVETLKLIYDDIMRIVNSAKEFLFSIPEKISELQVLLLKRETMLTVITIAVELFIVISLTTLSIKRIRRYFDKKIEFIETNKDEILLLTNAEVWLLSLLEFITPYLISFVSGYIILLIFRLQQYGLKIGIILFSSILTYIFIKNILKILLIIEKDNICLIPAEKETRIHLFRTAMRFSTVTIFGLSVIAVFNIFNFQGGYINDNFIFILWMIFKIVIYSLTVFELAQWKKNIIYGIFHMNIPYLDFFIAPKTMKMISRIVFKLYPTILTFVCFIFLTHILEYTELTYYLIRASLKTFLAIIGGFALFRFVTYLIYSALSPYEPDHRKIPFSNSFSQTSYDFTKYIIRYCILVIILSYIMDIWGVNLEPVYAVMRTPSFKRYSSATFTILGIVIGNIILISFCNYFINKMFLPEDIEGERKDHILSRGRMLAPIIKNFVVYLLMFFGGVMIMKQLNIDPTPIILTAGVLGLATGIGANSLIKDFLSGFCILFEDQYAPGDIVMINSIRGTVEEVTLRITRLRLDEGGIALIPNGNIKDVMNLSNHKGGKNDTSDSGSDTQA